MKFLIVLIYCYLIKTIISQNCNECNCDLININNCTFCDGPINNKFETIDKKSFIYIAGNQQSNYSYFRDDNSINWKSIDIISLYGRNYDKRISCLAHQNDVKILFNYEEESFCQIRKDPNCIFDKNIIEMQLPKILKTLEINNVDGINLDFEFGNRYGEDKQYAQLLKIINNYLKSKNNNYLVSSAISLKYRDNFKNQIIDVLENSDFITIMAYDLNSNEKGINFTQYPNSPISVRSDLKKYYIDRVPNQFLNKLILILPFYGYITKCGKKNNEISIINDDNGLFSNECIIEDFKPKQITYKEINNLIYYNNDDILTSGILYDSSHLIPFANLIDSKGDRYQIVFDSPFSIYSKTISIGIGGIGCWSLDKIKGTSKQLIDSFYFSIKKENIGNNFILNPY